MLVKKCVQRIMTYTNLNAVDKYGINEGLITDPPARFLKPPNFTHFTPRYFSIKTGLLTVKLLY